ncbi:hypothetical protein EIP91_010963 [Steccherinum ochraceum]|uniref:NRDE protein-domain-containing protein n=1 Tax=Steccherinum ochraceum TaxID=92696 RepID=A0A4R0RQ67_9APHY|nr:hypothetical protein EIP91_010963 [Steccherinum ochraceum]
MPAPANPRSSEASIIIPIWQLGDVRDHVAGTCSSKMAPGQFQREKNTPMCVGFWSLEHDEYALILCSNRDESLPRPTAPAHFHSFENLDGPPVADGQVLSGRDLQAGGTWQGLSRAGRVAFLTNITEEPGQYSSTRGQLASTFLLPDPPDTTLHEHVNTLINRNVSYAGFNLLLLSPTSQTSEDALSFDAAYVTNHGGGGSIISRPLTPSERRCGGLSNGIEGRGAEEWPKVVHGMSAFEDILEHTGAKTSEDELVELLFDLLASRHGAPPSLSELRSFIQIEPIPRKASRSPDAPADPYGTRLSTVILVRRDGRAVFIERDIWTLDGEKKVTKADAKKQRTFRLRLLDG